jgi:hypothetical protein
MTEEEKKKAYKKARRFYDKYKLIHYFNSAKRKIRMAVKK